MKRKVLLRIILEKNKRVPIDVTWTTSNNVITLDVEGKPFTVSYSISGTILTVTNSTTGFIEDGEWTKGGSELGK
jgi:hypothetical protein